MHLTIQDTDIPVTTPANAVENIEQFLKSYEGGRVMFSLAEPDPQGWQQFRCWDGPFGRVSESRIDSCGKNLLFTFVTNPEEMSEFRQAMEQGVLKKYRRWRLADVDAYSDQPRTTLWLGN